MTARLHRMYSGRGQRAVRCAAAGLTALAVLAACAPRHVVLEESGGIVVTLRQERGAPRPPPGPEFAQDLDAPLKRSLARVVVRYQKIIVFNDSEPVPLFSTEQQAALHRVLLRELPTLPPDKRLGFAFKDVYLRYDVDVEVYPEGGWLVYDFLSLQRRTSPGTPGMYPINLGKLFPQRGQIAENGRHPMLKDPIASEAKPDLRLPPGKDRQPAEPDEPPLM
jgi:hypothetical protein